MCQSGIVTGIVDFCRSCGLSRASARTPPDVALSDGARGLCLLGECL